MSDFKVPDVVWIDGISLEIVSEAGFSGLAMLDINPHAKWSDYSYTLTTTAEENTRKAVREVIEKIIGAVTSAQTQAEHLRVAYQDEGDEEEEEAYNMVGHETAYDLTLDMLKLYLTRYQDPQP